MNDIIESTDNPVWLSTYGVLTAERLLERFKITLSREELVDALKNQASPYHHLLTVPLKNISNGIIIKQVQDYQVYMQKLFIDYKLNSTKVEVENEQPAQGSGEAIEMQFNELEELSTLFEEKKHEHQQLIAKSQAWLIQQTHESMLEITPETSSQIELFGTQIESLRLTFQDLLYQFRELIIQTTNTLDMMSDYKLDSDQMDENKTFLDFDPLLTKSAN
jgi:hypothetical protein